jgi:type I restriction enzyme S subunit
MVLEKGFKKTDVGIIPDHWKINSLNEISTITRLAGYEYSTMWKEEINGEIIALRGFNIGQNRIIEREFVRISNELSLRLKRSRLYKGNVVYPCVGSIGNAVVIVEDDKYHIQQNIAKIIPDESEIFPLFLSYYLMSDFGFKEIQKFNGSSSQPNILVSSLRKYSIILPTLPEQTAIATALSDMDELIAQTEKLIEKKKAIKQGVMQELLRPKEGWDKMKLKDILEYEQPIKYIVKSDKYSDNNSIPVLTAGKSFILGYTSEDFNIFEDLPTIIFDDFTTASQYVDFKFKVKSSAMKILMLRNKKMNLRLIFEMLQNIKYQVADHKRHWIGEFQNIELFLPKLDEMIKLGKVVTDINQEIKLLEAKQNKLKFHKQGMMQVLLTGKIRLV